MSKTTEKQKGKNPSNVFSYTQLFKRSKTDTQQLTFLPFIWFTYVLTRKSIWPLIFDFV